MSDIQIPSKKWLRIISPAEFDKLPHLHCAGTDTANTPIYCYNSSLQDSRTTPRCIFQLTLSGYGVIEYKETIYKVDRGKALIFAKKEDALYHYPSGETQPWQFVFCEFWNLDDAVEQLNLRHGPVYELGVDHFVIKKIEALLKKQKEERSQMMMNGFESYEICSEIIGTMCRIVEAKDRAGSLAIKARNLIFQHRSEPFSLTELAAGMGVSAEHLCREFKKHLGDTPKHYYDRLRIHAMVDCLVNSSQPIKEIAGEFGYRSIANFNAFLKKHTTFTPAQFRRGKRSDGIIDW